MRSLVILLTLLSFSIIQCAESGVGSSFSTKNEGEDNGKNEVTDDPTTYTGDVKKINFFDGGWYGPYPNYNIDFVLTLNSENSVTALIDTPECKVKAAASVEDYKALIELVEGAELKPVPVPLPIVVDRGSKYINLSTVSGEDQKPNENRFYLEFEHPQVSDDDAAAIENKVYAIVDALIEANGCDNLEIQALTIDQDTYDLDYYGSPLPHPFSIDANITRDFKIELVDGQYLVSGREVKRQRYGGCSTTLQNVALPTNLIEPMHAIEFQRVEFICLVQFMGNAGLEITAQREGGILETGRAGCWNPNQIRNHQNFMDGFIKFIESQNPQSKACWAQ